MSGWDGGSTRAWRVVRAAVLRRDGYRCRAHADGHCDRVPPSRGTHACTKRATHAHHTQGRAVTGDDPRFIVAACAPCNLFIGEPTRKDPPCRPITQWT